MLTGAWIKYSSNAGYVNTPEYRATLHAFSHWTFHVSRGLLMVTDLQVNPISIFIAQLIAIWNYLGPYNLQV